MSSAYITSVLGMYRDNLSSVSQENGTWLHTPLLSNLTTSGQTTVLQLCSPWTFRTLFMLICSIMIVAFNTPLAAIFVAESKLHTSFSTYITALLLFNSLKAVHGFIGVVQHLCPHILRNITLCDFRNYIAWCVLILPDNLHIVIALNRVWAVGFPLSYRDYHSTKLAVGLVIFVVIYVHAINLPGVIVDSLYFRQTKEPFECYVDPKGMPQWYQTAMLLVFEFPGVVITIAWVFVVWKRRKQTNTVRAGSMMMFASEAATRPQSKRQAASFAAFTALTFSAVICWLPYETIFVIGSFRPLTESERALIPYLLSLNTLQPALDPLLIVLTSQSVKAVFAKKFGCS